ncbi:MAG: T9SS type A sorting domain-containing protein, partial [Candidatus Latescibacterota bacterium]
FTSWAAATRNYLGSHTDTNVIIWSWCGGVSHASKTDIDTYLSLMSGLEKEYPSISFVYMTGHHDGTGLAGNLHIRNEQIREYCRANNKILYDFNDIETYDPDGQYFGDKIPTDNCDYDSNGDGKQDSNWALEWQNAHPGAWYNCDAAHSQPLNGNLKAYAAWWLWSSLAGWTGETTDVKEQGVIQPELFNLRQNFPNPFNPSTAIRYELGTSGKVSISVYNTLGQQVNRFDLGQKEKGAYEFLFDGSGLTSGVYFYLAETGYAEAVGKMLLVK